MKKKSIIIDEFHHKELAKISKTFGSQYGNLIESMIQYFKRTGINPLEAINENPATLVKVLDKRIISFIRAQERDILKPFRNEVYQYSTEQKIQYDHLAGWVKDAIKTINEYDSSRTNLIVQELKNIETKLNKQQNAIIVIAKLIDVKNKSGIQGKIKSIFK